MAIQLQFGVNIAAARRKLKNVKASLAFNKPGPVRDGYKKSAARYTTFLGRRANKLSRSGGEWPPLAKATLDQRKSEGNRSKRILFRTGKMLAQVKGGGAFAIKFVRNAVRVTFAKNRSGKLASYHHHGAGNLPVRTIIVPPDEATKTMMHRDARRGYFLAIRQALKK